MNGSPKYRVGAKIRLVDNSTMRERFRGATAIIKAIHEYHSGRFSYRVLAPAIDPERMFNISEDIIDKAILSNKVDKFYEAWFIKNQPPTYKQRKPKENPNEKTRRLATAYGVDWNHGLSKRNANNQLLSRTKGNRRR